jgi:ABC-2 type transport system permease protein
VSSSSRPFVSGLSSSFQQSVGKYFPARAGMWVFSGNPDPNALSPWVGYGVLLLYAAVAFAVGAVLLLRRDA